MEEEPAEASADSLTLVRRQAPEGAAEPAKDVARQEVAELKDESFEQAARKRVAGEPAPPAAPEVAREAFATGALSATGKAGQKKQDDAKETADRRVIGGRLEQDVDELKPIQLNEGNRDKARARSSTPDEPASVANVVGPEAQEVPEAKPAVAVPPADRDPTAQPISVSRTLRVQPALEATRAEQGYPTSRKRRKASSRTSTSRRSVPIGVSFSCATRGTSGTPMLVIGWLFVRLRSSNVLRRKTIASAPSTIVSLTSMWRRTINVPRPFVGPWYGSDPDRVSFLG